ncbi:MAG: type transport system permease protein [Acidobacteriota bacterium]|nr:type transport system permease protein [Acidobacteriota bacterium]
MWPLRIAAARLRPLNASTVLRTLIVGAIVAAFLYADYALFARLYVAMSRVEEETPFFALGLLRNLLSLVFLVASVILFSSSLTAAIGAFFTDLDLDVYHSAPRSKLRIAVSRWLKTLAQASAVVFLFLIPLVVSFAGHYEKPLLFQLVVLLNLALLLTIPVSLASLIILLLVRWFPVQRVHQIVASLAIVVLSLIVVAFRMSRPERFFQDISTGDVSEVLRSIELPAMSIYPSTSIAVLMTTEGAPLLAPRILIMAALLFLAFVLVARASYFTAFVRARESMAPMAIGAAQTTRLFDRLLTHADPPLRALLAKEVRTITRDVAQWSQVFLMAALLFMYLYNVRMLPLGGDARATLVAYANLGMAGFVISAICLRFAYPSVSAEGKAFWMLQTAPISYRQFLRVKVFVYAAPLTLLSLLLTAFANILLDANGVVWAFTMFGASLLAVTLVSLGVGLGALSPQFHIENPLQVGLSLGGFAYMAIAMAYVGAMMMLMARPVMRYFMARALSLGDGAGWLATLLPIVIALTLSAAMSVIPIRAAEHRLTRFSETD